MQKIALQRRWVIAAVAVVALLIVVFGLVPFLINADTFRPTIESQLSSSLGRQVSLGHLSLSLITGSLTAENISIADDPAFAATPFLQAKRLDVGVELSQLLFHHTVRITKLTVDSPAIELVHTQTGTWNFSSIGSTAATPPLAPGSAPAATPVSAPALSVDKLEIKGGSATVSSIPAVGNPFVCTDIDLTAKQFSFTNSFPFQLSVKLPGDGSLQLTGTAGPVAQKDASDTPFHATLQLKHFDPVAANVVAPSDGISMVADFNAQLDSDGADLTSTGKFVASRLQLARTGSPAPQPVNIDYTISDSLNSRTGQVSDLAIHTGSVAVHVNGGFRLTGQAVVLDLHLSAPNLPIDQLERLLPAVGISLPSGSSLQGGTLTANLAITGPANAITIVGPVEIDNTKLAGFDLGSKIQGINPLGGTSGGTEIEKLSTDLNSSPQTTQFSNIYASIPVIGTATGSGTISPSDALDFQLVAKFNSSSMAGGIANTGMNAMGNLLGNRSTSAANNGIPLTITGTASNPSIKANVGAMLKQQAGGLLGNSSGQKNTNPVKSLKGLFGK
ncbi:MAG: AsmA family protein [Terracidiphilus sp.]